MVANFAGRILGCWEPPGLASAQVSCSQDWCIAGNRLAGFEWTARDPGLHLSGEWVDQRQGESRQTGVRVCCARRRSVCCRLPRLGSARGLDRDRPAGCE